MRPTRRSWLDRRLKFVLTLYVLAAALMPLAHHDIVCHAKSTTHCQTCVIGSSAESADDSGDLARVDLAQVGEAECGRPSAAVSAALSPCIGRAPPTAL
jgi:hypothetical protein